MKDSIATRATSAAIYASTLGLQNATPFNTTGGLRDQFAGVKHESFYARHQNDEGIDVEEKYTELHNAKWGLATVSGEAAISLMVRGLTRAGDGILSSENIFGTTKNNLKLAGTHDGRRVEFISLHAAPEIWRDRIENLKPKIIFLESPSNPLTDIMDLEELGKLVAEYSFEDENTQEKYRPRIVVDSTFLPPILQKPLTFGADFVIDSLTKFASGNNLATGGMILGNDETDRELLFSVRNVSGNNIVQFNSLVLIAGLRDLSSRILTQSSNAMKVAEWLANHSKVEGVNYLGLPTHPQHALAKRQFSKGQDGQVLGYGNMIPFTLKGDMKFAQTVADNTGFLIMANLGLTDTVISHPAGSTHYRLTPQERKAAGIGDNLLRLSVGDERVDDTVDKLERALDRR